MATMDKLSRRAKAACNSAQLQGSRLSIGDDRAILRSVRLDRLGGDCGRVHPYRYSRRNCGDQDSR